MNRSQKFLGITLMASLLCGFTPMQSEAKEYKIGGMYTYDYHDGRHADWGGVRAPRRQDGDRGHQRLRYARRKPRSTCRPNLSSITIAGRKGAAEKARSLLKQNIIALTGVDCSGPAVLIAKEAEKFKTPVVSVGANAASLSSPHRIPLLLPQRDSEHQI